MKNSLWKVGETVYTICEKNMTKKVDENPLPVHIAVIMDGNRRYGEAIGIGPTEGHIQGGKTLESVIYWCKEIGIKVLTVYAFSTENTKRSAKEVNSLMNLFAKNFKKAGDDERVHENKIRIKALGKINELPFQVQKAIRYAEDRTIQYNDFYLNIAINYGGREELINAIKEICRNVKDGRINLNKVDENLITSSLYTNGIPEPSLIIRTSGEKRISNFLLWQAAHSHLYFTDVYWPDFKKMDLLKAIYSYQQRVM